MDFSKQELIDFLISSHVLRTDDYFRLKNDRLAPYFINIGGFDNGLAMRKLGDAFASLILSLGKQFDLLFGPAYKGIPIVIGTAISLSQQGSNVGIVYNRKEAKTHGEAGEKQDSQKSLLIGTHLNEDDRVIILDDVLTTAGTKIEIIDMLKKMCPSVNILAVIILVDRQEINVKGQNAIEEFTMSTRIPVIPVLTSLDIIQYLESTHIIDRTKLDRIKTYMRVYGTHIVKNQLGKIPMQTIINSQKSIIPACDVPTLEEFDTLLRETSELTEIGGYKLGFELALTYGLPKLVEHARKFTNKPLIYDHQKAGTDIPEKGKEFASVCKNAGIDTVILFPQAGPETERAWIYHALERGLNVIVGGLMSHKTYTANEGGFITDAGAMEIYRIAAQSGINNFVIPATKPNVIQSIQEIIEREGIVPTFYSPGFFAQGGNVETFKQLLGGRIHVIVGRELLKSDDKKQTVLEIMKKL